MSEWRHTFEVPACDWTGDTDAEYPVCGAADGDLGCGHTKAEPDPASPCGACDLPDASRVHMPETMAWDHPHIPTRCQCGHPIEPVR